jgi:hypothetical protein
VERIQIPMHKLQLLDKTILDREEAKEVIKVYSTIMASLNEYENQKIEEWGRDVEASSQVRTGAPTHLPLYLRAYTHAQTGITATLAVHRQTRAVDTAYLTAGSLGDILLRQSHTPLAPSWLLKSRPSSGSRCWSATPRPTC